jgi:hypothetical protein
LRDLAIPDSVADLITESLQAEGQRNQDESSQLANNLAAKLKESESKLDSLLDMLLDKAISQEEYLPKKESLLNEKTEIREKLTSLQGRGQKRFEPAIRFVNAHKQSTFLASWPNPQQLRDLLKKTGSNFSLADQTLAISLKKP